MARGHSLASVGVIRKTVLGEDEGSRGQRPSGAAALTASQTSLVSDMCQALYFRMEVLEA